MPSVRLEDRLAAFETDVRAAEREAQDLLDAERMKYGQASRDTVVLLQRARAMRGMTLAGLLRKPEDKHAPKNYQHLSLTSVAVKVQRKPQEMLPLAWAFWDHARRNLRISTPKATPASEHALVRQCWQRLRKELPEPLHIPLDMARMHYEHEVLRVAYHNDTTLVSMDPVAQIPRARFFSTEEDGKVFAWDMEELVDTLHDAFGGVFKNPYPPYTLFQHGQVRAILAHPLGQKLKQQQVEQAALRDGIRRETAQKLQQLGNVLKRDITNNPSLAVETNQALEAFKLYVLTLPNDERNALNKLQIHAVDSHTRHTYASTVEATLAALAGQGNDALCWHKAGDYFEQGAVQLLSRFEA